MIVIHATSLAAVQEQLAADAFTEMVPLPPSASIRSEVGEIVNVQGGGGACCDTVNVLPPTAMVPVLADPAFGATLN